jgi:predicted dehydrogenase
MNLLIKAQFQLKDLESIIPVIASSSLDSVFDMIDFVYIGTPPASHAILAKFALDNHKHVLLEKPLACTDEDSDSIVNAANIGWNNHQLIVNINIGMRFNRSVHEMRRYINDSLIGDLESMYLKLHFREWPRSWQKQPWLNTRQQGGPLVEVGSGDCVETSLFVCSQQ